MSRKTLLVVDDIQMSRTVISKFLRDEFDIFEAENGQQALDIIAARQIDAMMLDIIMPGMDGLEVLKAIRENRAHDRMGILVATSTKEKTERTALALGADDIVSKPYDPVVIRKRLSNILTVKDMGMNAEGGADAARIAAETLEAAAAIRRNVELVRACGDNPLMADRLLSDIGAQADRLEAAVRRERGDR